MNDHDANEIEARLRQMQPADPDPALKQRIAASLEPEGGEHVNPYPFPKPVAYALAAAACVVLAAVLWVAFTQEGDTPPIADDSDQPGIDEPLGNEPPAVPTPHEARLVLLQSPESLDKALDALLKVPSGSAPGSTPPIYTFADGRRLTRMEKLP